LPLTIKELLSFENIPEFTYKESSEINSLCETEDINKRGIHLLYCQGTQISSVTLGWICGFKRRKKEYIQNFRR